MEPIELLDRTVNTLLSVGEVREKLLSAVRSKAVKCLSECQGEYNECLEGCLSTVLAALGSSASALEVIRGQAGLITQQEVSRLALELNLLGGEGLPSGGQGPRVSDGTNGDPPPPGEICDTNPSSDWSCPGTTLRPEWVQPGGPWRMPDIDASRMRPSDVFGGVPNQYVYETTAGLPGTGRYPPNEWPQDIGRLLVMCLDNSVFPPQTCPFWTIVANVPAPPPGIIVPLPPPIRREPEEPPPPPPPPGGRQPGDGLIDRPQDEALPPGCIPADPCYPRRARQMFAGSRRVPPLPTDWWLMVRCVDNCSADWECWEGDCPPERPHPWRIFGPYRYCPGESVLDTIIRQCLGATPPPPRSRQPGIPPYVEPPPEEPPPEEPPTRPPGYETCPPREYRAPDIQYQSADPLCRHPLIFEAEIWEELGTYGSVGDMAEDLAKAIPDQIQMPPFLTLPPRL